MMLPPSTPAPWRAHSSPSSTSTTPTTTRGTRSFIQLSSTSDRLGSTLDTTRRYAADQDGGRIGVTSSSPALHGARLKPLTAMVTWSNSSGGVTMSRDAGGHVVSEPTWTSPQATSNVADRPAGTSNLVGPGWPANAPPLRITRVGRFRPAASSICMPTKPYSQHVVVPVLVIRNVRKMWPAAPWLVWYATCTCEVWQRPGPAAAVAGVGVAAGAPPGVGEAAGGSEGIGEAVSEVWGTRAGGCADT